MSSVERHTSMARRGAAGRRGAPQRGAAGNHRRRTQQERRADTRAKVLAASGRVFAARGYHAATLDEIAEQAGLSKGAVYYNFASKEDLFLALLGDRLQARLAESRAAYEHHPDERTRREAADDLLAALTRDPRWPPLFFEFVAHAGRDRRLREDFAAGFVVPAREQLRAAIEREAERAGVALGIPATHLAIALGALANGLLIERLFDPDGVPDDLFSRILALAAAGLRATEAKED
jgi:AcrR family transcriptional regulator